MDYEFYFLNPKNSFVNNIQTYIIENGFEKLAISKKSNEWRFQKEKTNITVWQEEDSEGIYIGILCIGMSEDDVENCLLICPECHSCNLIISILQCWNNTTTEQLFDEGKLDYGSGAYDRLGTRPPTHRCLECGCKWHNGVAMSHWNDIIKQGGSLTKEVLGLN